ncbi:DUF4274 domain-containing protein [Paenibacillus sp. NPDC058910]|uniref:DUF4274 domain-containing protein n=1 Tax=unclassified Paenibacillus TaxID=185978 RepID=UPI003685EAE5
MPTAILSNEKCDLGTGLLMFYRADGDRLLELKDVVSVSTLIEWKEFISKLYERIFNNEFSNKSISFTPLLTKVQAFKLRKSNPSNPDVFFDKSPSDDMEIPVL